MARLRCIFVLASALSSTVAVHYEYMPLPSSANARCLDGSPYGVFFCRAATNATWEIAVQGGGFCYTLHDCLERAGTPLGSSVTWAAEAPNMPCLDSGTNYITMQYCDGGSFSGTLADPVPVGNASIHFRGQANLMGTLDLMATLGLANASFLTFTGSSAGGVTTILHADAVAAALHTIAPSARIVAKPTCGYFIASNETFDEQLGSVFEMQGAAASLSPACQAALAPTSWRCFIPSYAVPFVATPMFFMQSRFDKWQLGNGELNLPCMRSQPFAPPYHPSTCSPAEDAAITAYGFTFMSFFSSVIEAPGSRNGAFLDACIFHGSTNSSIDGVTGEAAFEGWVAGGRAWYVMRCGTGPNATSTGPCDPSPICAPFP